MFIYWPAEDTLVKEASCTLNTHRTHRPPSDLLVVCSRTRGLSGGVSTASCYVFLFLSSKTFLDIEHSLRLHGAFFFYGAISCVGVMFLYFRLLETEGKSLEQIEKHFTQGLSAQRSM